LPAADKLLGRQLKIADDLILPALPESRHPAVRDRAEPERRRERTQLKKKLPPTMMLRGIYTRVYPHGRLAGHILGYTGKTGRNPDA
jgi:cell division protein FtsI/penicillin-binding protein 2